MLVDVGSIGNCLKAGDCMVGKEILSKFRFTSGDDSLVFKNAQLVPEVEKTAGGKTPDPLDGPADEILQRQRLKWQNDNQLDVHSEGPRRLEDIELWPAWTTMKNRSPKYPKMQLDDVQLTGVVLLPVALFGAICNWTVVYILSKLSTFRHSFGYLSASQTIANAFHSTVFLIYCCPMAITYELSVQTHLVMSLNRFFAVWTPYKYKTMFSDRNTKILLALVWLWTFAETFLFYEVICSFFYNELTGFFTFTDSALCLNIGWYADFLKYLTIVVIIVIMDVSTILKARSVSRKVSHNVSSNTSTQVTKRENNFLKQTVLQGFIFALELITYFILPYYFTSRWPLFFATSFAWVLVHAMDGLIIMLFNPEFKKFIVSRGKNHGAFDSNTQQTGSRISATTVNPYFLGN